MKLNQVIKMVFVASCVIFGAVNTVEANAANDTKKGMEALKNKDPDTAIKYFKKAEKKGDKEARYALGFLYSVNPKMKAEGVRLLHKNCKLGHKKSCETFDLLMEMACKRGLLEACTLPKFAK